jgi:uncharacterized protein (DUF1800 family)
MPDSQRHAAAIALTRFGMGARPGEIDAVAGDPRGWLIAQIDARGAPQPAGRFPSSLERAEAYQAFQNDARDARRLRTAPAEALSADMTSDGSAETAAEATGAMASMSDAVPATPRGRANPAALAALDAGRARRRDLVQGTTAEFLARAQLAAVTDAGFAERWALFWANAFSVSRTKLQSTIFLGQYEREAIRPNVFGRFEDLALAAESHPAMLWYLDQAQSVGPDSPAGERRRSGLNENLAREIMELHTVGSEAGYSQADVTEFARALTGWTTAGGRGRGAGQGNARRAARLAAIEGTPGANGFVFRAAVHEPGARTVMGRTYPAGGVEQGRAILRDLANRPETARRLSRKIAAHFIADDPPAALVERLTQSWTASGGDLAAVARTLIEAPESWLDPPVKMKTPYEFILSTHRALGTQPRRIQPLQQALQLMGQPVFNAPSPEGWPDTAADWAGPDALVKRLNWAKTIGDQAGQAEPVTIAQGALGPRLTDRTHQFVARAESRPEALTLFLMSPEFQRR